MVDYFEIVFVFVIAVTTAVVAAQLLNRVRYHTSSQAVFSPEPMSLLFDDGVLHHANAPALQSFALFPGTHVWDDLRDGLLARFPDFPETAGTCDQGSITMRSKQARDRTVVELNWRDGLCWVQLTEEPQLLSEETPNSDDHETLISCCKTMPHPAWKTDAAGNVSWSNSPYDVLAKRFPQPQDAPIFANAEENQKGRVALRSTDGSQEWFEIATLAMTEGAMHHAACVTALVRAEEAQRTFVQTLAKTFAHLPVGLAIFDKRGQLAIFNPAMVDLTGLHASFLATQPTMLGFFDALRENRRMPEPKNYRTWRQDISDVIAAASDGQYSETWTLEDGRTYAVQGRPHPDGATAFMIDDISAEITLSRSYRAEVVQFEALLDNVDDALVVFSGTAVLTFCNLAYRDLFGQNPEAAFADVTLADAIDLWAGKTTGIIDWEEIRTFVTTLGSRTTKYMDIRMLDGAKFHCDLSPLAGEATLIRFSKARAKSEPSKAYNRLQTR